jgi:hypothetical protein
MKFRSLVSFIALSASLLRFAEAADELKPVVPLAGAAVKSGAALGKGSSAAIRVRGIMVSGATRYVTIDDGRDPQRPGRWLKEGDAFNHYVVTKIENDHVVLADGITGENLRCELNESPIGISESSAVEPYSPEWINSSRNPMLRFAALLPPDIAGEWAKLAKDERDAVIAYYLKHGWRLEYAESSVAGGTFVFKNIYEEERNEVRAANRERFRSMLSPEQQETWSKIRMSPPIKAGSMPDVDIQRIAAERRAASEAFKATLTVEQRQALDSMNDFTKANWSKK